jgi:ABC-type multidrug transport system ATPase subunit
VEHDMSLVMGICDEVLVLSSGRMIAEGTPREIQADREVIAVYLGAEEEGAEEEGARDEGAGRESTNHGEAGADRA